MGNGNSYNGQVYQGSSREWNYIPEIDKLLPNESCFRELNAMQLCTKLRNLMYASFMKSTDSNEICAVRLRKRQIQVLKSADFQVKICEFQLNPYHLSMFSSPCGMISFRCFCNCKIFI